MICIVEYRYAIGKIVFLNIEMYNDKLEVPGVQIRNCPICTIFNFYTIVFLNVCQLEVYMYNCFKISSMSHTFLHINLLIIFCYHSFFLTSTYLVCLSPFYPTPARKEGKPFPEQRGVPRP